MPLAYTISGQVLIRDGSVATFETCCCGQDDPCQVVFTVDFIPTNSAAFGDVLADRGYANRAYTANLFGGFAFWTATCCQQDLNDVQMVTVNGDNGNQTVIAVPQCLAVAQNPPP